MLTTHFKLVWHTNRVRYGHRHIHVVLQRERWEVNANRFLPTLSQGSPKVPEKGTKVKGGKRSFLNDISSNYGGLEFIRTVDAGQHSKV